MAYRLGKHTVEDREAGALTIEGDGFAAAGEIASLLASPQVHQYLRMSLAEKSEADASVRSYRERLQHVYVGGQRPVSHVDEATRGARQELESKMAQLLGSARMELLKRLSWRIRDADALVDDEVANALGLTPVQRQVIAQAAIANEGDHAQVLNEIQAVRLRSQDALQDRGLQADKAGHQRILSLLTPEQREKFKRLQQGDH